MGAKKETNMFHSMRTTNRICEVQFHNLQTMTGSCFDGPHSMLSESIIFYRKTSFVLFYTSQPPLAKKMSVSVKDAE